MFGLDSIKFHEVRGRKSNYKKSHASFLILTYTAKVCNILEIKLHHAIIVKCWLLPKIISMDILMSYFIPVIWE